MIEYNYNEIPQTPPITGAEPNVPFNPADIANTSNSNIVPGPNGSVMSGGSFYSPNYSKGLAGWMIDAAGNVEFNDGVFRGNISGGTIDIGGSDSSSFHVDANGAMWLGSGSFATATFKVSSTGTVDVGSTLGIGYGDFTDQDLGIAVVYVTGLPRINWDESSDRFAMTKGLELSGDLLFLSGNAVLDATPNVDHTSSGPVEAVLNANASITAMELVYLSNDFSSNPVWLRADASAASTAANKMLAVALETKTAGNALRVALPGSFVRDDSWSWSLGVVLYVSETTGAITETAPTTSTAIVRKVGYSVTPDIIWFAPSAEHTVVP